MGATTGNATLPPRVSWVSGLLRIHDSMLADPLAEEVHRFVSRAFAVDRIYAVEIDHYWQEAVLRFSGDAPATELMNRLAAALTAPSPLDENVRLQQLLAWGPSRQHTRIYRYGGSFSAWRLTPLAGRHLKLSHEVVARHRHIARRVCEKLTGMPGVVAVRMRPFSSYLLVDVGPQGVDAESLLQIADDLVHGPPEDDVEDLLQREVVFVANRLQQAIYLLLAAGGFVMSVIGLIAPGIPTVPFVLLTSYFLARSSPELNERLLRSHLFGPMVRDWQKHRAMRPSVRWTLIGIMIILIHFSVFVVGVSLPTFVLMMVMSAITLFFILRMPTVLPSQMTDPDAPEEQPATPQLAWVRT